MVKINGKEYGINLDIKLGTQKLIKVIMKNPSSDKVDIYMEKILLDLLIPAPTKRELFEFRQSDIKHVFESFTEESEKMDSDFKKKLST